MDSIRNEVSEIIAPHVQEKLGVSFSCAATFKKCTVCYVQLANQTNLMNVISDLGFCVVFV